MKYLIKKTAKRSTIEKLKSLDIETFVNKVIYILNATNLGFSNLNFKKMEDINNLKIQQLKLLQLVEESNHFSTEDEYYVYCNDEISSYSKEEAEKLIQTEIDDIARVLDKNRIDLDILIS